MNAKTDSGALSVSVQQSHPIRLDVAFKCGSGRLVTLVGPSGSGKTTILRCIAGLHRVNMGEVTCAGVTWNKASGAHTPTRERRVGMMFQNYALFAHLSVRQNIALPMQCRSVPRVHEHIDSLLELVNMSGFDHRYPAQLSGGQKQRVALARALAGSPSALLLDEPFSAVDLVTRRKLRRDLARIRESLNMPIVMVTHDLEEAYELSDEMVVLHRGKTLVQASPREIMQRPPSAEVARLMGLNNLFTGIVAEHRVEAGISRLRWNGTMLECELNQAFQVGEEVDWVVPENRILLHQRVRPSRGERENPVFGTILELLTLGDFTRLLVEADDSKNEKITFRIPVHVTERNGLATGQRIGLSLKTEGIHMMRRTPGL